MPIVKRASRAVDPAASGRIPSLTDVEGILVGHYTSSRRPTGCTVITATEPFVAGVDIRGGAPGSYDTELLRAEKTVEKIHAVFLSGGSAFGLAVGSGVAAQLQERGWGLPVEGTRVPVVCGAILFDLELGDPAICPGHEGGYEACKAASSAAVPEGSVGAGAGATVGKYLGARRAMRGGLGSWSLATPQGLRVGALAAVNAVGNIVDPRSGTIIAGARNDDGTGFVDLTVQARRGKRPGVPLPQGTLIGVVATNARLGKAQCHTVACMAQDALARCIVPAHLPWDGDTVFALATGTYRSGRPADVGLVGTLAADVLATAILRAVRQAESWGPYPACRDYPVRSGSARLQGRCLDRRQRLPGALRERSLYRMRT